MRGVRVLFVCVSSPSFSSCSRSGGPLRPSFIGKNTQVAVCCVSQMFDYGVEAFVTKYCESPQSAIHSASQHTKVGFVGYIHFQGSRLSIRIFTKYPFGESGQKNEYIHIRINHLFLEFTVLYFLVRRTVYPFQFTTQKSSTHEHPCLFLSAPTLLTRYVVTRNFLTSSYDSTYGPSYR